MVNYHETLKSALITILPTYYETFLNDQIHTPCLSYYEVDNYDTAVGDTINYSKVSFIVKVWSNKISDLQKYALQVDAKMKALGYKRVSANELFDPNSTMGQKILRYEALFIEK